jgi:hypothetical protein
VGLAAVAAGGTVAQVRVAVLTNPSWSPDEKQALLSVMNALGSLRGTAASPVLGFLTRYEQALMDRGIDPGLY